MLEGVGYVSIQYCRAALAALVTYMHVGALNETLISFERGEGVLLRLLHPLSC